MAEITHKADLVWFTSYGQSYFEKSTFGGQLDAVIFKAFASRPCKCCNGTGILDKPWTQYSRVRRTSFGEDYVDVLAVPIHHPTGMTCDRCKGHGHIQVRAIRAPSDGMMIVNPTRQQCGRGAPDDDVLLRYAFVSSRLNAMPRDLAEVMLVAYGDEGEALSAQDPLDRRWMVAPMTEDGRELLGRIRSEASDSDNHFRAVASILDLRKSVAELKGKERVELDMLLFNVSEDSRQRLALAELVWDSLPEAA